MESTSRKTRVVKFGVFEVDLRSGELRKNGLKVKLQEKPFRILRVLLEHPGQVVNARGAAEATVARRHFCGL